MFAITNITWACGRGGNFEEGDNMVRPLDGARATKQWLNKTFRSDQGFWKFQLKDETRFWEDWFATEGDAWQEDFRRRQDPDLELQDNVRRWIDAPEGSVVEILDVGAGPLTVLGKRWGNRVIRITAVDALADRYDQILRASSITPLVRTQLCQTENLLERFEPDYFDFVHALNTLDHHYDPLRALGQMISVVKPGKCIYFKHRTDEAERAGHSGLHQWNFSLEDGKAFLWNEHQHTNIADEFAAWATLEYAEFEEPDWLGVALRKTRSGSGSDRAK
jgi:SAM-dependent methyltransferase